MSWLNYHHLLYFWTAAREGSITKACKQLHLTQPTVSGQRHEATALRPAGGGHGAVRDFGQPAAAGDAADAAPGQLQEEIALGRAQLRRAG